MVLLYEVKIDFKVVFSVWYQYFKMGFYDGSVAYVKYFLYVKHCIQHLRHLLIVLLSALL